MFKKLHATVLAAALISAPLAACNFVSQANATLAQVSGGDLTLACATFNVAVGYFNTVKPKNSAANLLLGANAQKIGANICANPPSSVSAALIDLGNAWITIQAATTLPGS